MVNKMKSEKEYILSCDEENLKEYNERVKKLDDGDDYVYHFDVLPQPYFGDVNNAKILLLAKNPSYSEYEDPVDRCRTPVLRQ